MFDTDKNVTFDLPSSINVLIIQDVGSLGICCIICKNFPPRSKIVESVLTAVQ